MKATQSRLDWLRTYYAALDQLRFDEIARFLHEDCVTVYPTGHVDRGRERIIKRAEAALGSLERIRHELRDAWEEGEELIFELEVTYWRRDGKTITRPGVGIFTFQDGLISQQRLFVDNEGVWG